MSLYRPNYPFFIHYTYILNWSGRLNIIKVFKPFFIPNILLT
jgi:hypothetical protein